MKKEKKYHTTRVQNEVVNNTYIPFARARLFVFQLILKS